MKKEKGIQNSRSTFAVLFYLNTSKVKKSGKCPVMGRITVDGKSTAFSTGLELRPEEWNAKEGAATGNMAEAKEVNGRIARYRSDLMKHYDMLLENKSYVTAETLKNALQGFTLKQNTLMQEMAALVEEKRLSLGIAITASTYRKYITIHKHMKGFLYHKYEVSDILFGQVDFAFLEAFNYYLKVCLQLSACTVNNYMKIFHSLIMRAMNKGLVFQDPFFEYEYEQVTVRRKWLSVDEIKALMKAELKHPTEIFVRDMFVFSTFTGIAYADLENLTYDNIGRQEDGTLCVTLNRQKTGSLAFIPLTDIPLRIMKKYQDTPFAGTGGKVFKMCTLTNADILLKKIAKKAGIDKRLTYHMSRHSFATLCLSMGVPIETVSKMLGHQSIDTTRIYAKITRTKLNEDMTSLAGRIKGRYRLARQ